MDKTVTIYTSESCPRNPGPGGWASLIVSDEGTTEIHSGKCATTNNRMGLTAVIEALRRVTEPCDVVIYSDLAYVVNPFVKGWIEKWKRDGRLTADNPCDCAPNSELWLEILSLLRRENIKKYEFFWISIQSDDPQKERCNELACAEAEKGEDYVENFLGGW